MVSWVMNNPKCKDCSTLLHCPRHDGPPVGSWASVARIMSDIEPDFDWDTWKDEQKDAECEAYFAELDES